MVRETPSVKDVFYIWGIAYANRRTDTTRPSSFFQKNLVVSTAHHAFPAPTPSSILLVWARSNEEAGANM
jgi:hypothetical protein